MKPMISPLLDDLDPFAPHVILDTVNTCKKCAGEYPALTWNSKLVTTGFCQPCSEIEVAAHEFQERTLNQGKRIQKFQTFCPPMYFNCDTKQLPLPYCYEKVMKGLRPRKGLILIGASRLGKTRSAYALLKGLYLEMEKSCFAITELQFSHELSKFGKSENTMSLIHKMCGVDYLFIDDLGKSVMTQRVVSELYYVIEERISHFKPLIVTMQLDGESFQRRMSQSSGDDIAEAIVKRLMEHCDLVEFKQHENRS